MPMYGSESLTGLPSGFEAKTQPDEMIGGEWRGAAFPNHFVAIWQSGRHAVRRDSCLFNFTARAAYAVRIPIVVRFRAIGR